jgi:hypothetical protein
MPTPQTTASGAAKSGRRATTAKSATASRARRTRPAAAKRQSPASGRSARQSSTAERAVLIPVGAALIARDRVAASFGDTFAHYNSTAKVNAQLRRFERRGTTARNRVERELRKTRVRVEREVRQTRTRVEREVRRRRRDGEELANRVQERLLELV